MNVFNCDKFLTLSNRCASSVRVFPFVSGRNQMLTMRPKQVIAVYRKQVTPRPREATKKGKHFKLIVIVANL